MNSVNKVIDFAKNELDVIVKLNAESTCNIRSQKVIFMHFNWNMEKNGICVLLHEIGHALQPDEITCVEAIGKYEDGEISKEDVYRSVWNEEVDAWERGEQLAKELDLDIDWDRFNKMKRKGLNSYKEYDV